MVVAFSCSEAPSEILTKCVVPPYAIAELPYCDDGLDRVILKVSLLSL